MSTRTKLVAALAALATTATCLASVSPSPAAASPSAPSPTAPAAVAASPAAVSAAAARPVTFPGNDGRAHRVTWDEHSLELDGERLVVYSGELHYWRLPSPDQWRDVLQKLKASGYNAVSLYFFWGYHSSRPGQLDFSGVRDIDRLLSMAEREGLYVIARPGPYINAEASMGGLPAYMTKYGGAPRTLDDPLSVAADLDWLDHVNAIIKRHQITDGGGSVIAYQVENEQISHGPKQIAYIEMLQRAVKDDGITVPLFHNDWGDGHGWNVPGGSGGSQLDLYAFDTYPLGFDCAGSRGRLSDYETRIRGYSPNTPVFIAEGQAGAFTAWGRDFQTSDCADFVDAAFTRQFAANNLANGATMTNAYMEYGGTNWGWTGDPGSGFTSYDYGAPIAEDRQIRPKMSAQKEYAYLSHAVLPIASAHSVTSPTFETDGGGAVRVDQRLSAEDAEQNSVSGNGTRVLTIRHNDSNDTSTSHVTMPLDLSVVPQPPQPASYRWNDSDTTAIRYTGDWTHAVGESWTSGDYQDDETFSATAGDSAEVRFTGPTIRWIAPDSSNHGTADVYVDGAKLATVDSYAGSATYQQVKFEANDLGAGEHTLKIVVTGQKGTPSSQGTFISIDAFDTSPTVTPPPAPGAEAYPRVPQEGAGITVRGRDATALVADYRFGAHRLVYSTSQLLTTLRKAPRDTLVLDGLDGSAGETVLRYDRRPRVDQVSGPDVEVTWDGERHDLRLNYTHGATSIVRVRGGGAPDLLVVLTDRDTVQTTWRLDAGKADVLVMGAPLVRTARVRGRTLALTGDSASSTTARAYAPHVNRVTWNGRRVPASRSSTGALVIRLPGTTQLSGSTITDWRKAASDPERERGFDDSAWRVADLVRSENPQHVAGAQAGVVLDAEEYDFHEGDVWYRGRFTPGSAATSASVWVKTGTAGVALAWLDDHYLGSVGDGKHTLAIPAGALKPGKPAVLSVLVRNMGQYEDWSADGRSKGGRGLVDVAIDGAGTWRWRLQGAVGADRPIDRARGLYNNGGLYGERQGWHLPGAPDRDWTRTGSLKSSRPGVTFYRAKVTVPSRRGTDNSWAVRFSDDSGQGDRYRALVFVNGWNTGQYVHDIGPQYEFTIPSGFLKPGKNTIAIAITAEEAGVGPDAVSLVNKWTVKGGVPSRPNYAPSWGDLHDW